MSNPEKKRVPVQGRNIRGRTAIPPGTIDYDEHILAWNGYVKLYGDYQTADRIAERGGFGYDELVSFLGHHPSTWKARKQS